MEQANKGVVDLIDRILKELLKKPGFKNAMRTILQNIDPESMRSLVRTSMWEDPEMFLAILGAIPATINAVITGLDELIIQLRTKFSPELLHDFVKSLVISIDKKTLKNVIENGKGLSKELLEVAEKALREEDNNPSNTREEK
jgi:hypothetical protein